VGLAFFLRFYKLTTLFCWPTLDEGWNGILALALSKDWNWRFFYTFGDAPPLPVWFAALLFKADASPAFALWFPAAVVSCLTVIVGYFAARRFFSRSFAIVCGGLLAFSYWPLFIGRFCHQGVWLPLWVCCFFYLWGRFQGSKQDKARRAWAAASGAALGLGSFTFTPWLGVAGLLFLWVFWALRLRSKKTRPEFLIFTGGFALSLLPFVLAVLREGYGHHIVSLSPWGGWFKEFQLFTNLFKYFAAMVWGAFEKDPAYVPVWGGFLNPLLGAFVFLGLGEMVRRWRSGMIQPSWLPSPRPGASGSWPGSWPSRGPSTSTNSPSPTGTQKPTRRISGGP
jgi:4-amino-4-deoxy-L-arabinose transferase-like glycosyltransferase